MEERNTEQIIPEEKTRFRKGVLIGVLVTAVVFVAGLLIVMSVVKSKYAVALINKQAADAQDVLDADSEKKIKELLGQIELYYYEDIDTEKLTAGLYKGRV